MSSNDEDRGRSAAIAELPQDGQPVASGHMKVQKDAGNSYSRSTSYKVVSVLEQADTKARKLKDLTRR
jgi:hypothetical protein